MIEGWAARRGEAKEERARTGGVGLSALWRRILVVCAAASAALPLWGPLGSLSGWGSEYGIPLGAVPVDVALVDLDGDGRRESVAVLTSTPTSWARELPSPRFPFDAGAVSVYRVDTNGALWRASETILYREVLFFVPGGGGCLMCVQREGLAAREPAQLLLWGHRLGELNRLLILSSRFGGIYDLAGTTLSTVSLVNFGRFSSTRDLKDLILVEGDPSIAVSDMDTDGANDLIIATEDDRLVRVLAGDGRGNVEHKSPMRREEVGGRGDEPRFVGTANLSKYPGYPALAIVVTKGGILSSEVQIIASRGDGRFVVGRPISATGQPRSAVWGDFDGDGIPDLIVAGLNALVFLKGTGMSPEGVPGFGGKTPVGDVSMSADLGLPVRMSVVDYDFDRKLDFVVANYGAATVDVWKGNGDGTFTRPHRHRFGDGARPVAVAVGDLDGNQLPDVVVACQGTNELSVVMNLGGLGMVTREVSRAVPGRLFAVGQVYGGAGYDLVFLDTTERALLDQTAARSESLGGVPIPYVDSVVIGHAQPVSESLPSLAFFPTPAVLRYELLPRAELEKAIREGRFTETRARALNCLVGKADPGTYASTGPLIGVASTGREIAQLALDGAEWAEKADNVTPTPTLRVTGSASGYAPTRIALGDLDGDGIAEIVFVDQARRVVVAYKLFLVGPNNTPWEWRAASIGRFLQAYVLRTSPSSFPAPVGVVIGDFVPVSRGGDVAILNARANTVEILEVTYDAARGRERLLEARVVGWGMTGPAPGDAVAVDLDANGRTDLVILSSEGNAISLLTRNNDPEGDPTRLLFDLATFSDARLTMPVGLATADFDKDGSPEVVVGGYQSRNAVVYTARAGKLEFRIEVKFKSGPYSVAVGDVNNDGLLDIAGISAAGLEITLGKGGWTFGDPVLTPASALGGLPFWFGLADLNADGKTDIAVATLEPGVLATRMEGVKVLFGPYPQP